jgi:hypothetical protein
MRRGFIRSKKIREIEVIDDITLLLDSVLLMCQLATNRREGVGVLHNYTNYQTSF